MRQMYEPGLAFNMDVTPITMWIADDLYKAVFGIFHQNYNLPFVTHLSGMEGEILVHKVQLQADVSQEVFWRHLTTGSPGEYRKQAGLWK